MNHEFGVHDIYLLLLQHCRGDIELARLLHHGIEDGLVKLDEIGTGALPRASAMLDLSELVVFATALRKIREDGLGERIIAMTNSTAYDVVKEVVKSKVPLGKRKITPANWMSLIRKDYYDGLGDAYTYFNAYHGRWLADRVAMVDTMLRAGIRQILSMPLTGNMPPNYLVHLGKAAQILGTQYMVNHYHPGFVH